MDKAEVNNQVNIQTIVYGEEPNKENENTVEGDYIELQIKQPLRLNICL